ncbi:AIR carboxylase family protein [Patescibacteria group bacterium]|nr:AIR carboxylase family protein [Patescibacteria group bacterium]MBU4579437.1 AIR carboxylase family protein [Patescibacteria group bacterium]MCG2696199.1 AIR carboxylase family protein [Candidatus Portnoybacteria bacterium]
MGYETGELLNEGKTKEIWGVVGNSNIVIVKNKKDITAFDDPEYTKEFALKAKYATTTTCRVFELLQKAGIPVAYQEQISETEFIAPNCAMIPLEVVARRLAVGSYLKRHPELNKQEGQPPHRFHRLVIEFFLKTTNGRLINNQGLVVVRDLNSQKGEEDPFILNPNEERWKLYHSKKPLWDPEANLCIFATAADAVGMMAMKNISFMEEITRKVFLVLEGAWNVLGLRLIDMKIEFGITDSGNILVADVIDNDSWRLKDQHWQELSKQAFRDGEKLDEVERKYGTVAQLVERFRIPNQAIVIWKGSEADDFIDLSLMDKIPGVSVIEVAKSGHKETDSALKKLEEIISLYPDGGVIITKVGRSNGLGPTLSTHTNWIVISVSADWKQKPQNIWSSLDMPSDAPMLTALYDKNALFAAMQILSQKNPIFYMLRQNAIEELDPQY